MIKIIHNPNNLQLLNSFYNKLSIIKDSVLSTLSLPNPLVNCLMAEILNLHSAKI